MHFFKETAATGHNGLVEFWAGGNHLDDGESQYLLPSNRKSRQSKTAHALDLVAFLKREIIPTTSTIIMKMDIEGSEFELLPLLVMRGAVCDLDKIFVETHHRLATSQQLEPYRHASALLGNVPGCKVQLSEMDDKSYHVDADATLNSC